MELLQLRLSPEGRSPCADHSVLYRRHHVDARWGTAALGFAEGLCDQFVSLHRNQEGPLMPVLPLCLWCLHFCRI